MGERTGIAWTDKTFNPWWGCTKVGPGCDNCYAEEWAKRWGTGWGDDAPRRYFGQKHWNDPRRWNRRAEIAGKPTLVFCASMADVFDNRADPRERARLWGLIKATPFLRWQLVTKRVSNIAKMLPEDWGATGYLNVWLIITVVNQEEADRDIERLLRVPCATYGLSIEPQIGRIVLADEWLKKLDWVIGGGESKQGAGEPRHYDLEWARSLIRQCRDAGVPYFQKQIGANYNTVQAAGADPMEWPEDLRVREFPA